MSDGRLFFRSAALVLLCLQAVYPAHGRNLHKRSFLELGCRGNFNQAYLARLERLCEECFQLYQEPEVYKICREDCYRNENFGKCAEALLVKGEERKRLDKMVEQVYGR